MLQERPATAAGECNWTEYFGKCMKNAGESLAVSRHPQSRGSLRLLRPRCFTGTRITRVLPAAPPPQLRFSSTNTPAPVLEIGAW